MSMLKGEWNDAIFILFKSSYTRRSAIYLERCFNF